MDDVHDLLSGQRRDSQAVLIRLVLLFASWIYALVMQFRNFAYDRGLLRVHHAAVPVISIGNITTGGTGKTPFAAWLANWLKVEHRQPALLSRGYRSLNRPSDDMASAASSDSGNDEKLVLDRLCPQVPHLQQRDRVQSAARAVSEFRCDVLILDDGFQHRRLHRDLDLVLVDALQPWGYDHVLPRGLLRENLSRLHRADLIIITRMDQCTAEQRLMLRARLLDIRGRDEHAAVAFQPQRLVDLEWQAKPLSLLAGKKAFGFCGIGNPVGFRQTLMSLGAEFIELQSFPDHHHYTDEELAAVARCAQDCSASVVLTTQKDLVKIKRESWAGPPLYAIEIGVEFLSGQELLESLLRRTVLTARKDVA